MFSAKRLAKKAALPSPMKRLASKGTVNTPHPHVMMPIGTTHSPAKNASMHINPPMPATKPAPTLPMKRLAKKTPTASPMKRMAKKGMR
jgi:hypothetical protein